MMGTGITRAHDTPKPTQQPQTMIGLASEKDPSSIRRLLQLVARRYESLVKHVATLGSADLMDKLEKKMVEDENEGGK